LKDYKVYPLSIKEQKELDYFLDKNLKTGHIRPSKSPCIVLFFFVKKKDGLTAQWSDNKEQISFTTDSEINWQGQGSLVLNQNWYLVGL